MPAAAHRLDNVARPPRIELRSGLHASIDEVARVSAPGHAFLRKEWFEAAEADRARTLVGRRGDGRPFAAIPLTSMGPAILGLQMVPGSYWPFRSPVVADDATQAELRHLLADLDARRSLGLAWRMGPVYADDPAVRNLTDAAVGEGWTLLERPLGRTFVIDMAALRKSGAWPRRKMVRKVEARERQLSQQGPLRIEHHRGDGWSAAILDALAAIEANSWVGLRTDGSGAKFLRPSQRAYWERALQDDRIAEMLSATLLFVGDQPAAFSFDLNVGRLQYGIAGSYDERFARWSAGRIVTWRHLEASEARGIEIVDWGSGDSGYKSEFGAVPGSAIVDRLFVRSRPLAAVLRPKWTKPEDAQADEAAAKLLSKREQILLAAIVTAATAATIAE